MSSNQQFCLRWNNHQSTLISVFDHLLESGTLVDCTLAAEGQFLKAHKVVLSACSPYLEALLSQHYEKHPILILKDVSFHELKSMLDYMYRGEVNISQEQLGTFLKAAESLQIKGLTDCGALSESREIERPREMELGRIPGEFSRNDRSLSSVFPKRIDIRKQIPIQPRPRSPLVGLPANFVMNTDHRKVNKQPLPLDGNLGISNAIRNREGSLSPTVKRKKPNSFGSQNEDPSVPPAIENNIDQNHFHQQKSEQIQNSSPVSQNLSNSVPVSTNMSETKKLLESENSVDSEVIKREVKMENVEFTDEVQNEDSVEDLTVDEEEEEMDEMDLSQPGPSTASNSLVAGVPWHSAGEGNGDDGLLASQHDSQDERRDKLTPLKSTKHRVGVSCGDCGSRSWSNGLVVHKDSCPKMDKSKMYQCQCGDIFSNKRALTIHRVACSGPSFVSLTRKTYKCSKCIKSFRSKKTLNLHVESCTFVPGRSLVVVCKCGKECKSAQGLSMHQRRCEIVDYSGQLRDFSKPLHEEAERKSPKTDSRRRTPSLREGFDVEKEKPVDFKPVSEKGESGLAKTVRNTESCPGRESNKSEVKEQVSSDSKNNSASASEIIKEIAEDFHSEPSTPTKEDELMNAVALRDADNMNDDEEEYCRHLPLSPVSSLKDTPVKTSVQLEKSPEKEPMKSDSSRSSTSPTPKKKIKRSSKKHLNNSPVSERIQKKNCSDSKKNQFGKPKKFLCKCGKAFKTKDAYKKHKTVLCTLKMMRCNWCMYQTRDTNSMRNHVVNTHRDLLLNACSDSSSE